MCVCVCGGGLRTAPPTDLENHASDGRRKRHEKTRRDLKLLLSSFSGQVNIEVTRGNQRPNFVKTEIFRKQALSPAKV